MCSMDLTLLTFLALVVGVLIVILTLFIGRSSSQFRGSDQRQPQGQEQNQQVRRAVGNRNVRRRLQGNIIVGQDEPSNRSDENHDGRQDNERIDTSEQKIGSKKRAKLEAKAEKKAQREALEREREERKKKEQLLLAEKDKENERECAEELRRKEAEKKAREEKERKDYEQYLKMKETFSVEEEGYEEDSVKDTENLLRKFIDYIKQNKVLLLEDLAAHFGLKIAFVIDRIQELQSARNLTGVIDDRGKFIYISQEELNAVAKFVRQQGRVSIAELAENSNHLINLNYGKILESR